MCCKFHENRPGGYVVGTNGLKNLFYTWKEGPLCRNIQDTRNLSQRCCWGAVWVNPSRPSRTTYNKEKDKLENRFLLSDNHSQIFDSWFMADYWNTVHCILIGLKVVLLSCCKKIQPQIIFDCSCGYTLSRKKNQ